MYFSDMLTIAIKKSHFLTRCKHQMHAAPTPTNATALELYNELDMYCFEREGERQR